MAVLPSTEITLNNVSHQTVFTNSLMVSSDSQTLQAGEDALIGEIQSHPDVNLYYYPERGLIPSTSYVYDYPLSADYRIGILIDPCRYNAYNCCMNVYGSSEYHALLTSGLEAERVFKYIVLANETEVTSKYVCRSFNDLSNTFLVII